MNDITTSSRSIANPRRTTLVSRSASEAAAPHHGHHAHGAGEGVGLDGLQILADDGAMCADGSCALPE